MVLDRKDNESNGVLRITGRDVEEASYSLIFECGKWSANGNGLDEAAQRADEHQLGHTKRMVLRFVKSRPLTRTADVVENLDIKPDAARQTLFRLTQEGRIKRLSPGVYIPVTQSQPIKKVTLDHITGHDDALSDRHTVTVMEDRATSKSELSQRMSQSESLRSEGHHTDRDTVTRNLESLRSLHSLRRRKLRMVTSSMCESTPFLPSRPAEGGLRANRNSQREGLRGDRLRSSLFWLELLRRHPTLLRARRRVDRRAGEALDGSSMRPNLR